MREYKSTNKTINTHLQTTFFGDIVETSFFEGEFGDYQDMDYSHMNKTYEPDKLLDLMDELRYEFGYNYQESDIEFDKIMFNVMVDEEMNPLDNYELKAWEQGEKRAWTLNIRICVEEHKVEEIDLLTRVLYLEGK